MHLLQPWPFWPISNCSKITGMSAVMPPLIHHLAYHPDSLALFAAVRDLDWPLWLDSAGTGGDNGRYDIITAQPFTRLKTRGMVTEISPVDGQSEQSEACPFALLQRELKRYPSHSDDYPFTGGAAGYFGYDLGRRIETLPTTATDREQLPEMLIGIYDWALINDHQQKTTTLVSYAHHHSTRALWPQLIARLQNPASPFHNDFRVSGELKANLDDAAYQQAFEKIQHYIHEGDCYQVNLAKRFEISASGDPFEAYQQQRQLNAAPFSAYFQTPEATILSASPERLLSVSQGLVETKPIKGTRPRDRFDPVRDQQLAEELQNSLKDRAENLMIVDLLRNDLGKVCRPGSVSVPRPFALESFATVHHLVTTIIGELAAGEDAVTLMRACFPGGSITGAPKLRAMEIIEELEPDRRGVYCGSMAYIGFDGDMDSSITIRTLVHSDDRLRFWAGGGIVADSELRAEQQEVNDKAAAMFALIEQLR